MLTYTPRWSHARGNTVVPSPWQATPGEVVGNRCPAGSPTPAAAMVRFRHPDGSQMDADTSRTVS